jgi:predicted NACHT family NTPase
MRKRELSGGLRAVGILLRLRSLPKYEDRIDDASERIRAELDHVVSNELGVPEDPATLEYLLTAGRLALVLDGLDELPTADERLRLRGGLDSFAERYPLVPLVVTSRIIGYDDAPLDSHRFRRAWLDDYTDSQAAEFVRRWFSISATDGESADASALAVLQQVRAAGALQSSPVLLGLLCGLHWRTGSIPRSWVDLYESCVDIFFEDWDRDRPTGPSLLRALVRPELAAVAWWILWNPRLGQGVTERSLHSQVEGSFHQKIQISGEAAAGADDFIEYCRGRRWLFAEVGIDINGKPIFHFTHRTFMEFLAAEHLIRYFSRHPNDHQGFAEVIQELLDGGHESVALIAMTLFARLGENSDLAAEIRACVKTDDERLALEPFVERWQAEEAENMRGLNKSP